MTVDCISETTDAKGSGKMFFKCQKKSTINPESYTWVKKKILPKIKGNQDILR